MTRKFSTRFPVLAGTLAGRELADLIAEYNRLMDDTRRLRVEKDDLGRTGERDARQADADALAKAMRAGNKDPGAVNNAAFQARLADVERRLEGAVRAMTLVQEDIGALLDDRDAAYLADVVTLHEQARARLADAIAAFNEATNDERRLRSVMTWLSGGTKTASELTVPGLTRTATGDPYTLAQVLDALVGTITAEPA